MLDRIRQPYFLFVKSLEKIGNRVIIKINSRSYLFNYRLLYCNDWLCRCHDRRFFLNNNDKVLITFSCGVAELNGEEMPYDALKRADDAMYLAKRAGKNRVVPA